MKGSVSERFWAKVNKKGPIPPTQPWLGRCWVWIGGTLNAGYGEFYFQGEIALAHRVSWELSRGRPPKKNICHKCDNPPCIRPTHLFSCTTAQNAADCIAKGRAVRYDRNGERNPRVKLTVKDVRLIRRLAKTQSRRILAARFGVSKGAINFIVWGTNWRSVK